MWRFLFIVFLLSAGIPAVAQKLDAIGKEKPLSLTGGLSLNQVFYGVNGIESRRAPYTYFASGNLNLSLYGWSVPVSFAVSNQQVTFQQPFNQYSLHPTYKWITGHIGYTSMSFSPYTVNGHMFLGGGVDLAPGGKWKVSALYGRFLKPVKPDTSNPNNVLPSFQRMGYGFKASYGDGNDYADLILFHARDQVNSLAYVPEEQAVLPQENLVVSVGGGKTLFKSLLLKGEFSTSALSRDVRAEEAGHSNVLSKAGFLYTSRVSSSYYNAYKTSLNYQMGAYSVGVAYEHIDPQYRTLGAYYFNNDLENIALTGSAALMKGRMNVAASAGKQRDNLDKAKISTMRRMVGSLNVNYTPSQRLNLSASYSTFQTYTNIRSQFVNINQLTPYDNLDTLNFTQISRNATFTGSYQLGKDEKRRQHLSLNLNYQNAADRQGDVPQNSGMKFYNMNTAWSMSIVPKSLTVSVSGNGTFNEGAGMSTRTFGPTASVSKSFFEKKLRVTLSSSFNSTYSDGTRINTIRNGRLNGSLTLHKKHNLSLSMVAASRQSKTSAGARSFTEFTGMLGYSYSFAIK